MDGYETREYGSEVRSLKLGGMIVCQRLTKGEWDTFYEIETADDSAEALSSFACRIMQRKLAGLPVLRERIGDA